MSRISDELAATRKSYWDREHEAARNTSVLLVEGDDDKAVVEAILKRRGSAYSLQVTVVVAGSCKNVLDGARHFPGSMVHLLVDRDTWLDEEVDAQKKLAAPSSLHVTSGWCLENIFLAPRFLSALSPAVTAQLNLVLDARVRAGALWWTVQRAREAQQRWHAALGKNYGAPHPSIDVSSTEGLSDSLARLFSGDSSIAPLSIDYIIDLYERRLAEVQSLPSAEQWQHVHGKRVFEQILNPLLDKTLGRRESWRVELAQAVGRPPPLDSLIAQILP